MKRMFAIGTAAAVLVASGAFAATVIGGSGDSDRAPSRTVTLDVKRVSPKDAAAAGATVSAKKKKKPKILYFVGNAITGIPANELTNRLQLSCGSNQRVLGGFWNTNRFLYNDVNTQVDKDTWELAFVEAGGIDGGSVTPGIVCAKGVK
jgi:hypothetical protein